MSVSIQGDAAGGNVVKAWDQADQGRFTHPGGTHQGHHLVGRDIQVDILQHGCIG